MYINPFPLRATVVWDDCDDRALLYDDDILKLVNMDLLSPLLQEPPSVGLAPHFCSNLVPCIPDS